MMSNKKTTKQLKAKAEIVFDLMLNAIADYDEKHPEDITSDEDAINAAMTLIYNIIMHHHNHDPVEIRKSLEIMVEGMVRQSRETNLKSVK